MKKIIYLCLTLLLLKISLLAEDCGINTQCPDKNYSYIFCEKDATSGRYINKVYKCTNNPYSLAPDYIPLKPPIAICLKLDRTTFKCDEYKVGKQSGGEQHSVLNVTKIDEELNTGIYEWLCLCGMQNEPCKCEIDVILDGDNNHFNPGDLAYAKYRQSSEPISGYECELDCDSQIGFNNTQDFTGSSPDDCVKSKAFFVNNSMIESDENYGMTILIDGFIIYNFLEILEHEIGHLFGLNHHRENGFPICDNEEPADGVMSQGELPAYTQRNHLSQDDICQFKKLHCPDLVGVNEYNSNKAKKSKPFPNPSEDITNISFSLSSYSETTILYVYNCLGNTVKILDLKNLDFSNEVHIIQIPTNDLAPGQYFYKIVNETTVETGKFIIVR